MGKKRLLAFVLVGLLTVGLAVVPGCGPAEEAPEPEPMGIDESAEILAVTAQYFENPVSVISAEDLFDQLQAGDPRIMLVDIRAADRFEAGHIEGSIHIPFDRIWAEEELAKLDHAKRIVVVCYTGQTASFAALFWQQLGFNAIPLRFGIAHWSDNPTLHAEGVLPTGIAKGYPVEADIEEAEPVYDLPTVDTDADDVDEALINTTREYFEKGLPALITVDDAHEIFASNDPGYQFLDVRDYEHYILGHIPGSINIPWKRTADTEKLKALDPDKRIIVVCYTGHVAGQVTMFLNQLGYDAVHLLYGLAEWTDDPVTRVIPVYNPADILDLPIVQGPAD